MEDKNWWGFKTWPSHVAYIVQSQWATFSPLVDDEDGLWSYTIPKKLHGLQFLLKTFNLSLWKKKSLKRWKGNKMIKYQKVKEKTLCANKWYFHEISIREQQIFLKWLAYQIRRWSGKRKRRDKDFLKTKWLTCMWWLSWCWPRLGMDNHF